MKDIIKEFENMSMRDKINEWGDTDIIAIFDFLAEGSMKRDEAEKELQRIQMANIDLCIKEAYEKGRLETIKEIEDYIDRIRENDRHNLFKEVWKEIQSILNQLKDNE